MASQSTISVTSSQPGATPFISFVQLQSNSLGYQMGDGLDDLTAIQYTIQPKPGSLSRPVDVTFTIAALQRRGYAVTGSGTMTLPVFGLYAGYPNRLSIRLQFQDASTQSLSSVVTTAAYSDPNGIYDHPNVLKHRSPGSVLGFDFFAMKSALGTPVVVDTDGEIRWVAAGVADAFSSILQDNAFVVGDQGSMNFWRLELDGSISQSSISSTTYTNFHHNIDVGRFGLLAEVNAVDAGVANVASTVAEFIVSTGAVTKDWDFAALLAAYMQRQGDDPSTFVRPGADWFHMNSAIYDPRDDSVIISSRENFIIKVDYGSGDIIWILGDPTKYWYTFPSLRAKALQLQAGGLYPIGQHALSITSDGLLMLFNDGFASVNEPAGAPAGSSRSYSAVSAYSIDPVARTAQEVWDFDYGQSIFSGVCSSAYEAPGKSLLVDYAYATSGTSARLVGLDASHNVVFDFEYASSACNTSWNAIPIPLEDMQFN
jgi:arylsulfate sulfotransferase